MHGWMDQSIDPRLASPQNAAGTKINEIITRHMLISQARFLDHSRLQL